MSPADIGTYIEAVPAIPIIRDTDVVAARLAARTLASRVGFRGTDLVLIASAVSEVARNIVAHAGPGAVVLSVIQNRSRRGLEVIARDQGPGIVDVPLALEKGFSTIGSLGLGLSGSRRFMDEFHLESVPGVGTTVTMRKWLS
jgi:serine/threonine-protein kinase RsbT